MKLTVHRIFLVSTFILVLQSDNGGTSYPKNNNSRIVGGYRCYIEDYPFVVSLRQIARQPQRFCGGVLIRTNWVLTAAHCTAEHRAENLYIVAGITYSVDPNGQTSYVMLIVNHHAFIDVNGALYDDISLLKLETDVQLDKSTGLAILPPIGFTAKQIKATAMGWGSHLQVNMGFSVKKTMMTSSYSNKESTHLMCVDLPLITIDECREKWQGFIGANKKFDGKLMVCTMFAPGGKDACQGDSGSGVAVGRYVIGIISFGLGCAQPDTPAVNTKVEGYLDFINETLDKYEFYTQYFHRKVDPKTSNDATNWCGRLEIIPIYLMVHRWYTTYCFSV